MQRIGNAKLLALDVDGVMTDGGVYISDGGLEYKKFSIRDGLGLKLILEKGVKVAIISSSKSRAVEFRAKSLGIDEIHIGVDDKLSVLHHIVNKYKLTFSDVIFIGDDLVDIKCMESVGIPVTVKNGHQRVKEKSVYVTKNRGGDGAVREICDLILGKV